MYDQNSYQEPFWAENKGFMTGRDPLGVQNSSVATYAGLLPGMTNVTQRLRYYGFYLWLLCEYDEWKKSETEQTLEFQYNFIRRAELAIAYMMVNKYPNERGIIGSDFANRNINTIQNSGFYDLAVGADKNKKTVKGSVYWDYTSGALGQYFAGSLVSLHLVEMNYRFFKPCNKGKSLAEAYKKSVSESSRNVLLDVVRVGKLNTKQIEKLTEFSLAGILPDSAEWRFYKDLMLSDDGEKNSLGDVKWQRKETIKYYLESIQSNTDKRLFNQKQYLRNIKKPEHDASFGWYYYYTNELFHYSLETIFWGLLVELDGKIVDTRKFIENISEKVAKQSCEQSLESVNETIADILEKGFQEDVLGEQKKLESCVKEKASIDAIVLAFKMILRVYCQNLPNMDLLNSYERTNFLTDKNGRISEVVSCYIKNNLNSSYSHYIQTSIKRLINGHISTAYRKMGNGESNLLKFVIEDNFITHVQTMWPKFTSPRLGTLDNFLVDLKLIEGESLSNAGKTLLFELSGNHD